MDRRLLPVIPDHHAHRQIHSETCPRSAVSLSKPASRLSASHTAMLACAFLFFMFPPSHLHDAHLMMLGFVSLVPLLLPLLTCLVRSRPVSSCLGSGLYLHSSRPLYRPLLFCPYPLLSPIPRLATDLDRLVYKINTFANIANFYSRLLFFSASPHLSSIRHIFSRSLLF